MDRQSDPSSVETVAVAARQATSARSFAEEGRFLPGTLLGRGSMGEVYPATELTLGTMEYVDGKDLSSPAARHNRADTTETG